MSALTDPAITDPESVEPGKFDPSAPENNIWYRQFYVWLIIFLPLCAVSASFATLYIAAKNAPELAVDDYASIQSFSEAQMDRDRRAAELSLSAILSVAEAEDSSGDFPVEIELQANDDFLWPDTIFVRVVHSTKGILDSSAEFTGMLGRYTGSIALPKGAYDIHLEDTDRNWRLSTRVNGQPPQIVLEAFRANSQSKSTP
jgi:hypothetical protein